MSVHAQAALLFLLTLVLTVIGMQRSTPRPSDWQRAAMSRIPRRSIDNANLAAVASYGVCFGLALSQAATIGMMSGFLYGLNGAILGSLAAGFVITRGGGGGGPVA